MAAVLGGKVFSKLNGHWIGCIVFTYRLFIL